MQYGYGRLLDMLENDIYMFYAPNSLVYSVYFDCQTPDTFNK